MADTINFSAIAASFPPLESLSCPETYDFYGSLEQLGRLRILCVSAWESAVRANQPWLPLRSTETLTELSSKYRPDVDMPSFDLDSLSALVNLKSLNIRPLTESFCDFLITARIQLDVFEATLIRRHAPIHKFVDLLRADCL